MSTPNPKLQTPNRSLHLFNQDRIIFTSHSILMKYPATVLLSFITVLCFAQNGYEIKVTLKPFKNQYIYLGHYYGKTLPIIDSIKLNDKSEGVFKGDKKLGGGIYLIGFPDRSHNFEILIDKNQSFSIFVDTADL